MTSKSLGDYCSIGCFWAGIALALASAYCFLIAPIDYVALAIALFGGAVGLELIAVLLRRKRAARSADDGAPARD